MAPSQVPAPAIQIKKEPAHTVKEEATQAAAAVAVELTGNIKEEAACGVKQEADAAYGVKQEAAADGAKHEAAQVIGANAGLANLAALYPEIISDPSFMATLLHSQLLGAGGGAAGPQQPVDWAAILAAVSVPLPAPPGAELPAALRLPAAAAAPPALRLRLPPLPGRGSAGSPATPRARQERRSGSRARTTAAAARTTAARTSTGASAARSALWRARARLHNASPKPPAPWAASQQIQMGRRRSRRSLTCPPGSSAPWR